MEFDITIKDLHKKQNIKNVKYEKYFTSEKEDGVNGPDELMLDDLLEIIQGPVPKNGSIIIATTNKYEEIKELCPALFRPGRLTPVLFDYADKYTVNEMCKHFYNKELKEKIDIYKYKISPSQLIQFVTESKIANDSDPYEYFINQIKKITINL